MAETKNTLDKKKVETVKLLLSSLFARKQKFLIVDGNNKNRLIYTNFPYERTIYYRATPEDTICGVTVNDELIPLLHEAFPIFEKIVAELNLQQFMSAVNKCLAADKTKWPEIRIDKEHDEILIDLPEKEEGADTSVVCVGRLLPPDSLQYYEGIMSQFLKFTKDPFEMDFEIPEGHFNDPVILSDLLVPAPQPVTIKLPIQDGLSTVSFKEYLKKRNFPIKYRAFVQYRPDVRAARIALGYHDDWVNCLSMMPGMIWYPFVEM